VVEGSGAGNATLRKHQGCNTGCAAFTKGGLDVSDTNLAKQIHAGYRRRKWLGGGILCECKACAQNSQVCHDMIGPYHVCNDTAFS
jgi:hypothetical protein